MTDHRLPPIAPPLQYPPPFILCALRRTDALQQSTSHRPKIGTALEGGGAFGLARIGVRQWFDERRILVRL